MKTYPVLSFGFDFYGNDWTVEVRKPLGPHQMCAVTLETDIRCPEGFEKLQVEKVIPEDFSLDDIEDKINEFLWSRILKMGV
jgi:hypothetical protein